MPPQRGIAMLLQYLPIVGHCLCSRLQNSSPGDSKMNDAIPTAGDIYTVTLQLDQKGYFYPSISANHQDALKRASAAHYHVGGSWPIGARCLVHGPCRDAEC